VWGRDAHNGWVYNVGTTFYFDVGRGTASFDTRSGALPRSTNRSLPALPRR
jgi:hypothetical protein